MKKELKSYVAPEGYVYDFKEPRENGTHLYAKYLRITWFDDISNYILTEDPNNVKED